MVKPRLNHGPHSGKSHINRKPSPGLMIAEEPPSPEGMKSVEWSSEPAQPAIFNAEPLGEGREAERCPQEQDLRGHPEHEKSLGNTEKVGIGVFSHPLEGVEEGLRIVTDLEVAGGETMGAALLLQPP